MREFNSVTAFFGDLAVPGRIEALEGGRGLMRVSLNGAPDISEGAEAILEMHDGVRFRVAVTERLDDTNEVRMKLLARS
ncbi:hypothetical protein DEDE109153_08760 [Deinococcus deserti]|uniref:Uncharacterized protein n=1 Tax=Deinococcus deserti (strain DSM 17065 / CIP 109153 / LMG 22923 / VCD115) TaxID=546414 RepID=X5HLP4_DEIDV|nr:hypothetical protein [Deinococcus deserti]AHX26581.1 hypothetical protein Deide_3p02615 [Deinococcus deserti VCD115]